MAPVRYQALVTPPINQELSESESDLEEGITTQHAPIPVEHTIYHTLNSFMDHPPDTPAPSPSLPQLILIRLLPILTFLSYLTTLLYLLIIYYAIPTKTPWYTSQIPFLSDIVLLHLKSFKIGVWLTAILFTLTQWEERWSRFRRVLVEAMDERDLWIGVALGDIVVQFAASVALVAMR